MHKINYPILALIIANIIWGATSPIIKFSLDNIPPISLAFLRFFIASLILYPFVHTHIDYKDLRNKWLWVYALFGITLNIIFFFWSLQRTASINAPVISAIAPVMVLVGSGIYLKEKVTRAAIIGTLVSLTGITLVVFQPLIEHGPDTEILGNLFMIIATVGAVISTLAGRKFLTPENAAGMTFWACLIGTLTFLPFMLFEFSQNPVWMANLNIKGWVGIIYGGLFASTIAYAAYNWALSKVPAFRTSVFTYIDPVAAIIIAIPLLGERLTLPFILGSLLVFLGIFIAEKRIHYPPLHRILESGKI